MSGEQDILVVTRREADRGQLSGQEWSVREGYADTTLDRWFVPDNANERQFNAAMEGISQLISSYLRSDGAA